VSELKREYIIRKASIAFTLRLILTALKFLSLIIVIKAVRKEGYGIYALLLSVATQINFFELGLGAYVVKRISAWGNNPPKEEADKLISTGFFGILSIGLFLCIIILVFFFTAFDGVFKIPKEISNSISLGKIFVTAFFFLSFGIIFCNRVLIGLHQFEIIRLVHIGAQIIQSLMVILLITPQNSLGYNINLMAVIAIFINLLLFISLWYFWEKKFPIKVSVSIKHIDRKMILQSVNFSWPLVLEKTMSFIMTRVDIWILGAYLGPSYVAILDLAKKIYETILQLVSELAITIFPFSNWILETKKEIFKSFFQESTYYIFTLTAFLSLGVAIFCPPLILICLGREFIDSYPLIWILLTGLTITSLTLSGNECLLALGKYIHLIKYQLISSLLSICLQIYLVTKFQAIGLVFGVLSGMIVLTIGSLWENNIWIKGEALPTLKSLLRPILILGILLIIGFFIMPITKVNNLVALILWGILYMILYTSLCFLFIIKEKEKGVFFDIIVKIYTNIFTNKH